MRYFKNENSNWKFLTLCFAKVVQYYDVRKHIVCGHTRIVTALQLPFYHEPLSSRNLILSREASRRQTHFTSFHGMSKQIAIWMRFCRLVCLSTLHSIWLVIAIQLNREYCLSVKSSTSIVTRKYSLFILDSNTHDDVYSESFEWGDGLSKDETQVILEQMVERQSHFSTLILLISVKRNTVFPL